MSDSECALGEVFYAFVDVEHPPGAEVTLPATLPLGDAFEEIGRARSRTKSPDGTITHRFELALMTFDVGDVELPSVPVTYAVEGDVQEIGTEPIPIRVTSYIGDGEEVLREIAPPVPVHKRDWTLLYVIGGVGAVFVVALVVVLLARLLGRPWRRGVVKETSEPSREPPAVEALFRLERLEGSGVLNADDLKPAYHQMSEIVRHYLGRRFNVPALDLTTSEIVASLSSNPESTHRGERLREWLEHCDLVKFASHPASVGEARRAFREAVFLVNEDWAREIGSSDEEQEVA